MSTDARLVDTAFTTYQGPRAGRLAAIWSLARWSALRALGARRGWKAKLIPISLTLLAFAPALVVLGLRAILGSGSVSRNVANAVPYSDYISTAAIARCRSTFPPPSAASTTCSARWPRR
jgi:ABC-2 type transport system permease protein